MATTQYLTGRKWKVSRDGKASVTAKYRVLLETPLVKDAEGNSLASVPVPGDEHPTRDDLEVASVDYEEEQSQGGQKIVMATVNYESKVSTSEIISTELPIKYQVDEWGWDAGTEDRELLNDVETNDPVVNSAGDPFDSVPKVHVYSPTFTKVMKFPSRMSGTVAFNGHVNDAQITIGDVVCAPGTLLVSVSEKRIFGDPDWNYSYTVQLKYKSNKVNVFGAETNPTEIGWHAAIADLGMRQIDPDDDTKRILIRQRDKETGEMCVVSSPALLDGNGYAISDTDTDRSPRNLLFKAYAEATIPSWFYSEPPIVRPTEGN